MGKSRITTWEKMKKALRGKFLPDNNLQEWFSKLYNFPQGNKSVDEYTEEFDLLMVRCSIDEPEEQTISRYLGGLRKEIHDMVTLQPYWSYDDVYKLAVKVEKQLKQKASRTASGFGPRNPIRKEQPFVSVREPEKPIPRHFEKGANGKRDGSSSSSRSTGFGNRMVKCFKCSGLGYVQADCPRVLSTLQVRLWFRVTQSKKMILLYMMNTMMMMMTVLHGVIMERP